MKLSKEDLAFAKDEVKKQTRMIREWGKLIQEAQRTRTFFTRLLMENIDEREDE